MKINLSKTRLVTLFILLVCNNLLLAQSKNEFKLKYLKENDKLVKNAGKDRIGCYVKIDTVQLLSDAGLKFSIRLKNNLDDTINIRNPMEAFNPVLTNDSFNVIFVRYEYFGEPKPRPLILKSVIVDYVAVNGEPTEINLIEAKNITIPPKGNCEIFLKIIKSRKNKSDDPYDFSKAIPLRNGKYYFSCMISVVENGGYNSFHIEPILINYKSCD